MDYCIVLADDLAVSAMMGRIIGICILLIVVVFILKKVMGKK